MAISTINQNSLASPTTFPSTAVFPTTIGVGGATASSSGAGITFPATQSASTNANTLDDYEEGTWTPVDGSGAGLTFSVTSANYRKIGSMVFVNAYLTYPGTGDATGANIAGLPYAAASGNQYSYIMGRTQANLGNMLVWQAQASGTALAANWGWNSASATPTNAQLSGGFLLISGWYIASA